MNESEKDIEKRILCFLEAIGAFAWKHNNVGVYDRNIGAFRKPSSRFHRKGIPDILGFLGKKHLYIEVKKPGGAVSPEQREIIIKALEADGISFVTRSVRQTWDQLCMFITPEQQDLIRHIAANHIASEDMIMPKLKARKPKARSKMN